MRFFRNMSPLPAEQSSRANNRRKGRVRADTLQTNLGPAKDLSETGIRIAVDRSCKLQAGDRIMLQMRGPSHELASVGKVAWRRKVGWFKAEVGLEFLDNSETFRRALRELSASCMDLRTISHDCEDLARAAG
jgi:hypothetical protein